MIETENKLKNILLISSRLEARSLKLRSTPVNYQLSTISPDTARSKLLNTFKQMLLNNEDLSPEAIHAKFSPEPDLIIIEGEHSLQNAAIIEASYAELYFCDLLNEAQMERAVEDFHSRKRNFGV